MHANTNFKVVGVHVGPQPPALWDSGMYGVVLPPSNPRRPATVAALQSQQPRPSRADGGHAHRGSASITYEWELPIAPPPTIPKAIAPITYEAGAAPKPATAPLKRPSMVTKKPSSAPLGKKAADKPATATAAAVAADSAPAGPTEKPTRVAAKRVADVTSFQKDTGAAQWLIDKRNAAIAADDAQLRRKKSQISMIAERSDVTSKKPSAPAESKPRPKTAAAAAGGAAKKHTPTKPPPSVPAASKPPHTAPAPPPVPAQGIAPDPIVLSRPAPSSPHSPPQSPLQAHAQQVSPQRPTKSPSRLSVTHSPSRQVIQPQVSPVTVDGGAFGDLHDDSTSSLEHSHFMESPQPGSARTATPSKSPSLPPAPPPVYTSAASPAQAPAAKPHRKVPFERFTLPAQVSMGKNQRLQMSFGF